MKCYNCRKPGHMMANCLLLKSKPGICERKKAMSATCDELEGSESEEDSDNQEAVMCFIATKETINEGNETEVNGDNPSCDDLLCAFKEIQEDTEKLVKRIMS